MNDQSPFLITTVTAKPSYEPSKAQMERAAARRRFNRLYIYTPILIATAVSLAITGFMIWSIFAPNATENAAFLSGLADVILILILLPLVIIWGAIVALPIGLYIKYYNDRRQPVPADQIYVHQYGRFRLILWQISHKLDQLHQLLDERILPSIVNPIIRAHTKATALKAWIKNWSK